MYWQLISRFKTETDDFLINWTCPYLSAMWLVLIMASLTNIRVHLVFSSIQPLFSLSCALLLIYNAYSVVADFWMNVYDRYYACTGLQMDQSSMLFFLFYLYQKHTTIFWWFQLWQGDLADMLQWWIQYSQHNVPWYYLFIFSLLVLL